MRSVIILGSTGSIGTQALQVVENHPERFSIAALSAQSNKQLLFEQVRRFRPKAAALTLGVCEIPEDLKFCQWYFGPTALESMTVQVPCDDVLVAVSGMVGLRSVLGARRSGRRVLLANKEALVAGGQLVMDACVPQNGNPVLLPVDSEHSAIFQCLLCAQGNPFERLILTASGGPFRTWRREDMVKASVEETLKHPNWSMGAKITVDSATMFNKALEVIEARWLFDAAPEQIEVLIHPQSIVHSMVAFQDGAVLAQLGVPDMRVPIQFAMAYPQRLTSTATRLDWASMSQLHFETPDMDKFPSLRLSWQALKAGGAAACILNAANEVAVAAFLEGRISLGRIFEVVDACLQTTGYHPADSLNAVESADALARRIARNLTGA